MNPAKILIVDDVPENISVLFEFLISQGFDVSIAPDGESALEVTAEEVPDLILLDVMMPGIDGFETCRRLKAQARTRDVPVIFMTALSDTVDKVKGFQFGAVDYVTKPVQQDEVLGRINAHIKIRQLQQTLERRNGELDSFAHMVAHDLKNPLGVIENGVYLLKRDLASDLNEDISLHFSLISKSTRRMRGIIEGLLALAGVSHQTPVFEPLSSAEIVAQVLDRLKENVQTAEAEITLPERWPQAYGNPSWVDQLWTNYISNALKYGGTPPKIEIGASQEDGTARFWVKDNGPGLSPAQQAKLFIPFTRLHQERAEGHGVGLSIVQRIAEKLGGESGVDSKEGEGSLFYFTLPSTPKIGAE